MWDLIVSVPDFCLSFYFFPGSQLATGKEGCFLCALCRARIQHIMQSKGRYYHTISYQLLLVCVCVYIYKYRVS